MGTLGGCSNCTAHRGIKERQRREVRSLQAQGVAAGVGHRDGVIEPGHAWENGYGESFVGKLRNECLNEQRPHSSLGYRTPAEVARDGAVATEISSQEGAGLTS